MSAAMPAGRPVDPVVADGDGGHGAPADRGRPEGAALPPGRPVDRPAAIELADVGHRYGWRRAPALAGVSLRVDRGEVVALLGPNGSGKSTALRVVVGLVRPAAGRCTVLGVPVRGALGAAVPDVGAVLDVPGAGGAGRLPVATWLGLAARTLGVPGGRVGACLDQVGLRAMAGRPVGALSLGMRQRLALATALLRRPTVLVLDEPANGLDPAGAAGLRRLVRGHADAGGAVLLSTHHLADAARVADRVVVLAGGVVRADGPVEAVLGSAADLTGAESRYRSLVGAGAGGLAGVGAGAGDDVDGWWDR